MLIKNKTRIRPVAYVTDEGAVRPAASEGWTQLSALVTAVPDNARHVVVRLGGGVDQWCVIDLFDLQIPVGGWELQTRDLQTFATEKAATMAAYLTNLKTTSSFVTQRHKLNPEKE